MSVNTYAILINNVDDNNELSIVFSVVNKSDSPNFNVTLERLQKIIHTKLKN